MSVVLLVEDEPMIADLVEDVLRDRGLDVVQVHTGQEAWARLEGEAKTFAAIITDINLGNHVSGFDVARKARELNPQVKVVYITGLPSNIYAAEEEALMFPKPFDIGELAEQVCLLIA